MVKVIERPTSTTHVLNFNFHYIRDENEAENVKKILGDKKPLVIGHRIDETYQPIMYFAIPSDKPFMEWLKYGAPMRLMDDNHERRD